MIITACTIITIIQTDSNCDLSITIITSYYFLYRCLRASLASGMLVQQHILPAIHSIHYR